MNKIMEIEVSILDKCLKPPLIEAMRKKNTIRIPLGGWYYATATCEWSTLWPNLRKLWHRVLH